MGGNALRERALSDPRVAELVREHFVPVWINVRTTPVPDVPALEPKAIKVKLDKDRYVATFLRRGFLVRSIVITPDGQRMLNGETVGDGLPIVEPDEYIAMLRRSLDRFATPE